MWATAILPRLAPPAAPNVRARADESTPPEQAISVRRSGKVKGRASLSLAFTQLIASGKTYTLGARRISLLAPETHGKDAKIIGGGAGAGALVGAIADGKSGAAKGALVGGAAGTGAVLATRGKEVSIPAGSHWRVRLVRPLVLD